MKRLLFNYIVSFAIVAAFLLSCSNEFKYDDVNTYQGSSVLKVEQDTIDGYPVYKLYIKDAHDRYRDINVDPEYGQLFEAGDVI